MSAQLKLTKFNIEELSHLIKWVILKELKNAFAGGACFEWVYIIITPPHTRTHNAYKNVYLTHIFHTQILYLKCTQPIHPHMCLFMRSIYLYRSPSKAYQPPCICVFGLCKYLCATHTHRKCVQCVSTVSNKKYPTK